MGDLNSLPWHLSTSSALPDSLAYLSDSATAKSSFPVPQRPSTPQACRTQQYLSLASQRTPNWSGYLRNFAEEADFALPGGAAPEAELLGHGPSGTLQPYVNSTASILHKLAVRP